MCVMSLVEKSFKVFANTNSMSGMKSGAQGQLNGFTGDAGGKEVSVVILSQFTSMSWLPLTFHPFSPTTQVVGEDESNANYFLVRTMKKIL